MIYLAAPFFTPPQTAILDHIENLLEREDIPFFSPRREGGIINLYRGNDRNAHLRRVFESNVAGMCKCDMMLAGTDYKDTGTIWEMGFWFAEMGGGRLRSKLRNPLVTYSFTDAPANLMLSHSVNGHLRSSNELNDLVIHMREAFTRHGWPCYSNAVESFSFNEMQQTSE